VEDGIKLANKRGPTRSVLMYFGICSKDCFGSTTPTSQQDIKLGVNCYGYCTHAYAITKKTASVFLSELYDKNFVSRKKARSQIDQALLYFTRTHWKAYKSKLHSIVVGVNLVSPDFEEHNGLMYQCNRTKRAIEKGTSLSSDSFQPLPCYRMVLSESTVAEGLFQVAALVGACVRAGTHPTFCASLVSANSKSASLQIFMQSALSLSPTAKCSLKTEGNAKEDSDVVQILFTNTSTNLSPLNISNTFGATLEGSFRNLQYFHPRATWILYELISKVDCFYVGKEKHCLPRNEKYGRNDVCLSFQTTPNDYNSQKSIISYYIAAIDNFKSNRSGSIRVKIFEDTDTSSMNAIPLKDQLLRHYHGDSNVIFQSFSASAILKHSFVFEMTILRHLATCTNLIASNSLLSWWGAYFASQIGDAVVFVPEKDNRTVSSSSCGMHLPSWHVVPII